MEIEDEGRRHLTSPHKSGDAPAPAPGLPKALPLPRTLNVTLKVSLV